jgi:hypothetical protein
MYRCRAAERARMMGRDMMDGCAGAGAHPASPGKDTC